MMYLAKMSQSMKNWGARLDAAPHLVYRRKSRQKGPCNFSWGEKECQKPEKEAQQSGKGWSDNCLRQITAFCTVAFMY